MTDIRFAQSTASECRVPLIFAIVSTLVSFALVPAARIHADEKKKTGAEWIHEGNQQLQSNNFEKALEAYDRAQLALPDSAKVSYNRGLALYQLGRFDEAETALQNALRPNALDLEPDVKYSLGRCAQAASMATDGNLEAALNNAKRAVEFYQDALQLRADDADTKKNLAIAESQQKYFEKLIEIEKQKQQDQSEDQQQSQDPSDDDQEKKGDQQQDEQSGDGQKQDQEQEQSEGQSGEQNSEEKSEDGKESESESESSESKSDSDQQGDENKDQKSEQGAESDDDQNKPSEGQQDENDKRSDEQLGDDQLEDAQSDQQEKSEAQEMNQEPESESGSEGDEQQEAQPLQAATTQSATSMPAENPMEMAKRISIEKAQRLLQTARDKEARRREALRRAQLRNRGRARVEKDW